MRIFYSYLNNLIGFFAGRHMIKYIYTKNICEVWHNLSAQKRCCFDIILHLNCRLSSLDFQKCFVSIEKHLNGKQPPITEDDGGIPIDREEDRGIGKNNLTAGLILD